MKEWHHWHKKPGMHGPEFRHFPFMRGVPWGLLCGWTAWKHADKRRSRLFKSWRWGFPFADYEDTEEEYLLKLEVPGIEKENISAKAGDGTLTVEIEGEPYFYPLPPNVDAEKIYATLKLGIFTVHLPKKEPDKKVDIDS